MNNKTAVVIGGGLAGVEAAKQLSKKGIKVTLYEMKPKKFSPAHKSEKLAELVESEYSDIDVSVQFGGQPIYYFIISVE